MGAEGRGNVVGSEAMREGDRAVSRMREVERGVACPHAAAVFTQRHVADVEAPVLDPPVLPPVLQELPGREPPGTLVMV